MTYVPAIEPTPSPNLKKFKWLESVGDIPPATARKFPTLSVTWMGGGNMKAIYRLSFIGLGLLATGIGMMAFGVAHGQESQRVRLASTSTPTQKQIVGLGHRQHVLLEWRHA